MTTEATETPSEEVTIENFLEKFFSDLPFEYGDANKVVQTMTEQIGEAFFAIGEVNAVLLETEGKTSDAKVDSLLREYVKKSDPENAEIVEAWKERLEFKKQWDEIVAKTRNLYRVNVLNEEAVETPQVDEIGARNKRKVAMEAITLLRSFSEINQDTVILDWLNTLEVPQVGRQATTVVGIPKPRAFVSVDGHWFESFGEAAKELSDEEKKIKVSASDLVTAWMEAGKKKNEEFLFNAGEREVAVKMLPKKKGDATPASVSAEDSEPTEVDLEELEEEEADEAEDSSDDE